MICHNLQASWITKNIEDPIIMIHLLNLNQNEFQSMYSNIVLFVTPKITILIQK